jgi:NAD(P)H dehydrogenase (quinone)
MGNASMRSPTFLRGGALPTALAAAWCALLAARAVAADAPAPGEVRVLIAYHSRTGNTEKMAEGVAEGVKRVPGAVALVKRVEEVSKEELEAADGIILGCPTYFANVPGQMKTVIDDWNWKLKVDFTDKVGGAFSTAGGHVGGKEHVVVSLLLFMINNRMVVAGPLYENEETKSIWAELGAGAVTGPLDPGVSQDELDGARRLGERIARLAKKMAARNP